MRLGVLVSGRGSNLAAVLDACADGRLIRVEPGLVISNRAEVRALGVSDRHAVPWRVLSRNAFVDAGARDDAIGQAFAEAACDLVLLAGYDQLLTPPYFAAYRGPTINIHPSLLPRHGGPGMMGLAVHQSVLDADDAVSGVSIHVVTPELDGGPVIARAEVPVLPGDDAASLARRVLDAEHRLLVETLGSLAAGGLRDLASASMSDRPVTVEAD